MYYLYPSIPMFERKDICCPMLFTYDGERVQWPVFIYCDVEVMICLRYDYNAVIYDTNMLFLVLCYILWYVTYTLIVTYYCT